MGLWNSIRGWFGTSRTNTPVTQLAGSDGISAPGGYLWRGERDPDLVGRRLWLQFSDAIANSIVVAAAARYFLNLTAGTQWEAEGRDASKDAQRAADIVREGLYEADMAKPWSAIVRKHALYRFYGFSISEWAVRKRADGMIVYGTIEHRPQYTIQWWDKEDEQEPLLGVVQLTRIGKTYYIPRERMFYCVDDTLTDSPDGIGLMRHLISHVKRVQKYEQLEGVGFESDLRGIPLSRAPIAALKQQSSDKPAGWVDDQVRFIRDFGKAHLRTEDLSLTLDSANYKNPDGTVSSVPMWAMELIKGDNGPLEQVAAAINRVNTEIARVIGCEFMMMGGSSSGGGSRAMHEDKTAQFGNLIQSTLNEMAAFAKNDLARPLLGLNGLDPDLLTPKMLPGVVSTEEVNQVTASLLQLAQAGAPLLPNDPAIDQIRARLHLAAQPTLAPDLTGALRSKPQGKQPQKPTAPGADDGSVDVDTSDLGIGATA